MKFYRLRPLLFLFLATRFSADASSTAGALPVEMRKAVFLSGGRKIHVQIFAPKAPGRLPAVLVLHSSAGTLIGKGELERFSKKLAAQGMIAFLVRYFDRTGTIVAG